MGGWSLTTCLVLIVGFLNNIQALEADTNGYSAEEIKQIHSDFEKCTEKWLATIGEPCVSHSVSLPKLQRLFEIYKGDIPASEWKEQMKSVCHDTLECSADGKCECKGSSWSWFSSSPSCDQSENLRKNLDQNCDRESKAFGNWAAAHLRSRNKTVASMAGPGQNSQYIMLVAVITIFVASQ